MVLILLEVNGMSKKIYDAKDYIGKTCDKVYIIDM